jgi:mannosyltransferase OCH1-like enzyme
MSEKESYMTTPVPKILHYVWVGPKPLSDEAKRRIEGWHKIMPDYQIMSWNNDTIDFRHRFMRQALCVGGWNRISNFQRMVALVEHGGIYLDTDVEMRRSFDPLLDQSCFFGFQRTDVPTENVNGAVMGAVKGHWFIEELRNHFVEKLDGRHEVGSGTGPALISQKLSLQGLQNYSDTPVKVRDISVYPRRYFYPYHWEESFSESCITPDTYAVHLWEHTWRPTKPFFKRLKNRARRAAAEFVPEATFLFIRHTLPKAKELYLPFDGRL